MNTYINARQKVSDAFRKSGLPVTLIREVAGTYSPVTGRTSDSETQEYSTFGMMFDYSLQASGIRNQDGYLVQQGDKKIKVSALELGDIQPKATDKIRVNGVTYSVCNIKEVAPAGLPILYEIQGRR